MKAVDSKISSFIGNSIHINTRCFEIDNIKNRNAILSDKAIELISGPYPREIEYSSIELSEEFKPGIYNISDNKLNVTGKSNRALIINNDVYTIYNWKDIISKLCEKLYEIDPKKLQEVMSTNKIHKSTSKRNCKN